MPDRESTWWERFWFRPVTAVGLRIVRVVVFGVAAMVLFTDIGVLKPSIVNAGTLWDPISYYRLLPQPGAAALDVMYPLTVVLCGLAAFGLGGRRVSVPAGISGGYLAAIGNNLGKVNHDRNVLVMALFLLAFAPVIGEGEGRSYRFRWPVAGVALGYSLMFLFAGVSKLRTSGLEWIFSENLRNILVSENLLLRAPALSDVALWVAEEPWRWKPAAALAVLGELGLVVGVLSRRPILSAVFLAQGAGVIFGLNLFLDLGGWPLVVMTATLVDWDRVTTRLARPFPTLVVAGVFGIVAVVTLLMRPPTLVVRETALVVAMGVFSALWVHRASTSAPDVAPAEALESPA